jgi:hypothetical protein
MHTMLQRLFYYKREVRAFGTIAIVIITIVLMPFNSIVKHLLGLIDLLTNFRQIRKLEGRTILVYQCLYIQPVELEIIIFYSKAFLRKIEGLMYEVGICVVH